MTKRANFDQKRASYVYNMGPKAKMHGDVLKLFTIIAKLVKTRDGNVLERTDCTKLLGVYLDEKLKWHTHLNHISGKIAKGLGMLGRVSRILPSNVLRTLYHTLIYPYLNY